MNYKNLATILMILGIILWICVLSFHLSVIFPIFINILQILHIVYEKSELSKMVVQFVRESKRK